MTDKESKLVERHEVICKCGNVIDVSHVYEAGRQVSLDKMYKMGRGRTRTHMILDGMALQKAEAKGRREVIDLIDRKHKIFSTGDISIYNSDWKALKETEK